MRTPVVVALAAVGLIGWGLSGSLEAAVKSPDQLTDDQKIESGKAEQPTGIKGEPASKPNPNDPGHTSRQTSRGTTRPGQTGPAQDTSRPQISDEQLRQHARAHMALEKKAPVITARLKDAWDPNTAFTGIDRQELGRALQGTGVSAQDFMNVHGAVLQDPGVRSRFQRIMAQASGGQAAAGTSGQAAGSSLDTTGNTSGSKAPAGAESGAQSNASGAQPAASPR